MDTTPTSTSRRRVVQGIAWAAPAVAMTAAAPAFAVSCTQSHKFVPGILIDYGNDSRATTNYQFAFGGQVYVDGLRSGVTVTQVTEQWFFQNTSSSQLAGDGLLFIGDKSTNWYKNSKCTAVGCSVNWTAPIGPASTTDYTTKPGGPNSGPTGWSSVVKNTVNEKDTVFPDGTTYKAWDVIFTWTPSAGSGISGTGSCRNFTTGPTGKFGVNYFAVPRKARGSHIRGFVKITVTFNTGPALTFTSGMLDEVN